MSIALYISTKHQTDSGAFDLVFCTVMFTIVVAYTLWDRRYRRRCSNRKPETGRRSKGQFDEGDVITMKKSRSETIAGYEVWMYYVYRVDGEQGGIYTLSFATKEEAEESRRLLAHQHIPVRVAPGGKNESRVLDEDLATLLNKEEFR